LSIPYKHILITGGAGFVGSNLCVYLKRRFQGTRITALDNLRRKGSETNLPRLRMNGVEFVHGDIRNREDLEFEPIPDLVIECSAEPSVLAGFSNAPAYVINTNLAGTINCLELARRVHADVVFLSTSRVYSIAALNEINTLETTTRFTLHGTQSHPGVSLNGIAENFTLHGPRSLYGTTKLCSELILQEYGAMYGVRYIVNRCGVLTGPWQMGKVDQGVFALWVAMHYFNRKLSYIGWGGTGKQVRDLLHIDDLAELLCLQLKDFGKLSTGTFNVGGSSSSLSLLETTELCQEITGNRISVVGISDNRPADLKLYITDTRRIRAATGWIPRYSAKDTLQSIYDWLHQNRQSVQHIWVD
jgi:CDP-paratose 2-epimerase